MYNLTLTCMVFFLFLSNLATLHSHHGPKILCGLSYTFAYPANAGASQDFLDIKEPLLLQMTV